MSKRSSPPVGIGVITVVTILLVLTLSVFSALTLASARADLALSKRNAETVTTYYATGILPSAESMASGEENLPVWNGE